jgi:hypothetical protein
MTIDFKIKILGRLEGGRRTRRTLTTDNASKIFILKSIARERITTMDSTSKYEKRILREIKALPKVSDKKETS